MNGHENREHKKVFYNLKGVRKQEYTASLLYICFSCVERVLFLPSGLIPKVVLCFLCDLLNVYILSILLLIGGFF